MYSIETETVASMSGTGGSQKKEGKMRIRAFPVSDAHTIF